MDLCIILRTNLFPTSRTKINHLLLQDRKLVQFETQNDLQCRDNGGRGLGNKLPTKLKKTYVRFCGGWGWGGWVGNAPKLLVSFLRFVDRASRYNRVNKNQSDAQLSVVLVGLEQSSQDNRQSSKKTNKYQFLYTYDCTTW